MADVYVINNTITPMPIGAYTIVPAARFTEHNRRPGYLIVDDSVITAINALPASDTRRRNLAFCSVLTAADVAANPDVIAIKSAIGRT